MEQVVAPVCRREAARLRASDGALDAELSRWQDPSGLRLRLRLLGRVPLVLSCDAEQAVTGEAGRLLSMLAVRELGVSVPEAAARLYPGNDKQEGCRQVGQVARDLERQLAPVGGRVGQAHLSVTAIPGAAPVLRLRGVLTDAEVFRRLRLHIAAGHSTAIGVARELARGLIDLDETDLSSRLWHPVVFWVAFQEITTHDGVGDPDQQARGHDPTGGAAQVWQAGGRGTTEPARGHCSGGWLLAELGRSQHGRCPAHGGDLDATGTRLLTLPELRQALQMPAEGHLARRQKAPAARVDHDAGTHGWRASQMSVATDGNGTAPHTTAAAGSALSTTAQVQVTATHGGAGSSTVALALAEAAADQGRTVQLLTTAGSVLAAVTDREVGLDTDGCWRTGRRGRAVTVHRLIASGLGSDWSVPFTPSAAQLVICDLGGDRTLTEPQSGADPYRSHGSVVVLVCRLSVPGILNTEARLAAMGPGLSAVLVTVGAGRWPRVVQGAAGPRVRALLAAHRVAALPYERALAVHGPTTKPLPPPVVRAARTVLRLVEALSEPPSTTGWQPPPTAEPCSSLEVVA